MASSWLNFLTILVVMLFGFVSKNNYVRNKLANWIEVYILQSNRLNNALIPKSLTTDIEKKQYLALCMLKKYEEKTLQVNHIFRKRILNELSKHHQKQTTSIKQLDKFNQIDCAIIENNGKSVNTLIESFIETKNFPITIDDINKNNTSVAPLSLTKETLTHLVRDYNSMYYNAETLPIVDYILQTISKNVRNINDGNTDILLPGSGLGRVSYEVAKNFPHVNVTSVEYSDLMYIGNQLLYSCNKNIKISPWVIEYSNHLSVKDQLKSFNINCQDFEHPKNLNIELGDFRKFKINNNGNGKKKQLILITVFFMDTAENILEYLDTIESYKRDYETVHWINIGPLKYGTRPKVVLTVEEFTELRAARGWKDIQCSCSPKEEIGYITNNDGLYKGRYSLLKFHSIL